MSLLLEVLDQGEDACFGLGAEAQVAED